IIYDDKKQRAKGVRVMNIITHEESEYFAKIIFLNASTINSAAILLNSTSARFPNGLGNDSGVIGHYLMDHNFRAVITGTHEGFLDKYHDGRRPIGIYMPKFRNTGSDKQSSFIRGYGMQGAAERLGWERGMSGNDFGAAFKESLSIPGPWSMWLQGGGEMLPRYENKIAINKNKLDKWGFPEIEIDCQWSDNENEMTKDMLSQGSEMLSKAGFKDIANYDTNLAPGIGIHEMGTVRMGADAKNSALNKYNQLHHCKNVFVTDGAFMCSQSYQNPSITYMAFTARACNFAANELNKRNL
ncbi:MAG: GMC family oxidoreductase, partial [Saprospiraceae bacterium]|nr:GMC family oxidoreductase [Saprospiraceae bacterium]